MRAASPQRLHRAFTSKEAEAAQLQSKLELLQSDLASVQQELLATMSNDNTDVAYKQVTAGSSLSVLFYDDRYNETRDRHTLAIYRSLDRDGVPFIVGGSSFFIYARSIDKTEYSSRGEVTVGLKDCRTNVDPSQAGRTGTRGVSYSPTVLQTYRGRRGEEPRTYRFDWSRRS